MILNHKLKSSAGFSMVELLVALGTMIVISAASFALIGSSIRFSNSIYLMTDAEQALRNAHEVLNRDLTTCGDGLKGLGTIQVPVGFVQNYLTHTPIVISGNTNYVDLGLVTSDDGVPVGTAIPQTNPAVNVLTNSDRITMLTEDATFTPISLLPGKITVSGSNTLVQITSADIGRVQVGEIYAITSQNSAAFGVVTGINSATYVLTMANGDAYGLNQTGSGTPINAVSSGGTQATSLVRIQIIHYFVNANGLLIRRVFGVKGGGFIDSVVAEHVTNFQFRYMTNLTANGFVAQPLTSLTSSQQQLAVRQVETTIAVETVRAVNAVTNATAPSSMCGASVNGKQTICSTTATTVRNLQFRNALSP